MKDKLVEERLPTIVRFHRNLGKVMRQTVFAAAVRKARRLATKVKVESQPARDTVFGPFQLNGRFNVDQVGLAFENGLETTYDVAGTKRVHISQPLAGLEKRQCTVNICIGPVTSSSDRPSSFVEREESLRLRGQPKTLALTSSSRRAPGWSPLRASRGLSRAFFAASRAMRKPYRRSGQFYSWTICTRRRRTSSSGPSLKTAKGWCDFSHRAAPMRCNQSMRAMGVSLRWRSGGNWNCSSINMSTSTNDQLHLRVRATSPYRSVGDKCRRVRGRSAWQLPSPV